MVAWVVGALARFAALAWAASCRQTAKPDFRILHQTVPVPRFATMGFRSIVAFATSLISIFFAAGTAHAATFNYVDTASSGSTAIGAGTSCAAPLVRTINVTDSYTISDVKMGFIIQHPYRGDVQITVTSPNSTSVQVVSSNGGDGNDNWNIELDDASGNPLDNNLNHSTVAAPYQYTVSPSNALSAFDGENVNGTWTFSYCDTFTGADSGNLLRAELIVEDTAPPGPSSSTMVFADTGVGAYRSDIAWLTWGGTSLADGIQDGDQVTFPLLCSAGDLTVTFSNVVDNSQATGGPQTFVPSPMQTWGGASVFNHYGFSSADNDEALYGHTGPAPFAGGFADVQFRMTFTQTIKGVPVAPNIVFVDAETTNGTGEGITATTNGSSWRLIENIVGTNYTTTGFGTSAITFSDTETPSHSPVAMTEGATQLDVRVFTTSTGNFAFQAFAVGILSGCDRGDASGYGDPQHPLSLEATSPPGSTGSPSNIGNVTSSLHLGSNLPDTETALTADDNAQGREPDDEDGISTFPTLSESATSYTIPAANISTVNSTGADATLTAFIDFNDDGDFGDTGETTSATVTSGSSNPSSDLVFSGISVASAGSTANARFRLASDGVLNSTEGALNGEVEDYPITIAAATATPFVCDGTFYQYVNGDLSLRDMDFSTSTFNTVYTTPGTGSVNGAIGYRVQDNLIYSLSTAGANDGRLFRLDAAGVVTDLGFVVGNNRAAGEVLGDGRLVTIADSDNLLRFVDVTTATLSGTLGLSTTIRPFDFAFNDIDGRLYGIDQFSDRLFYINLTTGVVTFFGPTGVYTSSYGAAWFDVNGTFYAYDNSTGNVFSIDVGTNGSGSGTPVQLATFPTTGGNDGTSCRGAPPVPFDFGDAPASFGDASHAIDANIQLGANAPDSENSSQYTPDATGDGADEDGVTLPTLTAGDTSYTIPAANIATLNTTGSAATVYGFIDFNNDGDFDDAGETATAAVPNGNPNPSGDLTFTGFGSAPAAGTSLISRFRLTTDTGTLASGPASNGEVEDYQVTVQSIPVPPPGVCPAGPVGLIDAAFSVPSSGGAIGVGSSVRFEDVATIDGQTIDMIAAVTAMNNLTALDHLRSQGDDLKLALPDIDIGVGTLFEAELTYTFVQDGTTTPVPVSVEISLDDLDRRFDREEAISVPASEISGYFVDVSSDLNITYDGTNLTFTGTQDHSEGDPEATVKFLYQNRSSFTVTYLSQQLDPAGPGNAGFVMDFDDFTVLGNCGRYDYGDAPDTGAGSGAGNYETLQANNGPTNRIVSGLSFGGGSPDADNNGVPTAGADGDDNSTAGPSFDDEEAIASFPALTTTDSNYSLSGIGVTNTTGGNATLFGWIDLDQSGSFDEDERTSTTIANGATTAALTWSSLPGITDGTTYARFRLAATADLTAGSDGGVDEASLGIVNSGEVEDYQVTITVGGNDISGTIFEDAQYGGGAGRDYATADGAFANSEVGGATVELYDNAGALIATTTTAADGTYTFSSIADGDYYVRVVNDTVQSQRPGSIASLIGVQTFRTDGTTDVTNEVGGRDPTVADTGANAGGSLNTTSFALDGGQAQSVQPVTVSGADVTGVDFGFNFDTIVNTNDAGQGSLRQFIDNSNALTNGGLAQSGLTAGDETSIFMIPAGDLTSGVAVISPTTAYPNITDNNTIIDGRTQTTNIGDTNSGNIVGATTAGIDSLAVPAVARPEVQISGPGSAAFDLLTVGANDVGIHGIAAIGGRYGITTTGAPSGLTISENALGTGASALADPGATFQNRENIQSASQPGVGFTVQNNLIAYSERRGLRVGSSVGANVTVQANHFLQNGQSAGTASGSVEFLNNGASTVTVIGNAITPPAGVTDNGVELNNNGGATAGGTYRIENNTITGGDRGIDARFEDTVIYRNIVSSASAAGIFTDISGNMTISENRVFGNGAAGIDVETSATSGITISQNATYDNTDIGIDLNRDDITLNDANDSDTGPNGLLNFPIFGQASISGGNLTITGCAPAGAIIELFEADISPTSPTSPNASNAIGSVSQEYGEGETYLATLTEGSGGDTDAATCSLPVDADGNNPTGMNAFSFTIATPAGVASADLLTATATDASGNTSEFSPVVEANPPADYGDAPDTGAGTGTGNYETLNANGGPSHVIVAAHFLGAGVSADIDGFGDGIDDNGNATDDTNDDGVTIPTLTQGNNTTITVAFNQDAINSGYLQGWIDWNGDGDFDDTVNGQSEQIAVDLQDISVLSGNIAVPVTVPISATTSPTYARFRWSITSGLGATGAANSGEVEDYQVTIVAASPSVDVTKTSDSYPSGSGTFMIPGNDVIYTITVSNSGNIATDTDSMLLIDAMPGEIEFYNGDIDDGGPETDPIAFSQTGGAGLTFTYGTDVAFSDQATAPTSFAACTYTPAAGYDPNITFICINPKGAMAAGDPDPTFSLQFRGRIE